MANLRPKVLNANGYDELLDDGDNIQLVAAPATDDAAANKEYVDTVAESLQGEIDSIVNPGGDPAYVRKAGDNMTGDLTLGTDKISLNASDGSASCASGNVELKNFSTDYGAVAIRNTSGNQFYLTYAESDVLGLTARSATIANQTQPIKFNGADGSAEFAGRVSAGNEGVVNYGIVVKNESDNLPTVYARNFSTNANASVFEGYDETSSTAPTSTIYSDGSATLKGLTRISTETNSPVSGAAKGVEINPTGRVTCAKPSGNTESDQVFSGFAVGNSNATTKIFSDGSATFSGSLEAASIDGGSY